jgi:uncharacterized protein DUF3305
MSAAEPLARLAVGVVIERRNAKSAWADFIWRPSAVLAGEPDAAPWTLLEAQADRTTFYVGAGEIALYRSEAAFYRDNLATGEPMLWAVLRPTGGEPPFTVVTVTADPSEGEAFATIGTDLVEALPMPESIRAAIAAFVAEHHVEHAFAKRKRDRADPEALARRARIKDPS